MSKISVNKTLTDFGFWWLQWTLARDKYWLLLNAKPWGPLMLPSSPGGLTVRPYSSKIGALHWLTIKSFTKGRVMDVIDLFFYDSEWTFSKSIWVKYSAGLFYHWSFCIKAACKSWEPWEPLLCLEGPSCAMFKIVYTWLATSLVPRPSIT